MYLRRLPGVIRPGIACTIPTFAGPVVLIDIGANIEPKPAHLAQYGIMGDVYAHDILGIKRPRVALMNVGAARRTRVRRTPRKPVNCSKARPASTSSASSRAEASSTAKPMW